MLLALKRILIVDDDEGILKSMSRYLRKRGYNVSTVTSGKEALEWMAKETPSLVLLDILMPDMDGIETLEQIRKDYPDVEVVIISALKQEYVAENAMKMGAYEWLSKPFSMEELEKTIDVTLLHAVSTDATINNSIH